MSLTSPDQRFQAAGNNPERCKALREMLVACRERNDAVALDAIQTATLRGEIAAYKRLLGLLETTAPVINEEPAY